jgi:hypothetical protein
MQHLFSISSSCLLAKEHTYSILLYWFGGPNYLLVISLILWVCTTLVFVLNFFHLHSCILKQVTFFLYLFNKCISILFHCPFTMLSNVRDSLLSALGIITLFTQYKKSPFNNLQFSGKYLYRTCLTWCTITRWLPIFHMRTLEELSFYTLVKVALQ